VAITPVTIKGFPVPKEAPPVGTVNHDIVPPHPVAAKPKFTPPATKHFAAGVVAVGVAGIGFTVITALPEEVPVQFASLTAVTTYVVLTVGDTVNVYGEVKIFVTTGCATPLTV
jgi:hypothetical protein